MSPLKTLTNEELIEMWYIVENMGDDGVEMIRWSAYNNLIAFFDTTTSTTQEITRLIDEELERRGLLC